MKRTAARHSLIATCGVALTALAACSYVGVDRLDNAQPNGTAFDKALVKEYVTLTQAEADQSDFSDANAYARKARAAWNGNTVAPDDLASRKLPAEHFGGLGSARLRLVAALDGGGRDSAPSDAAKAQAMFDCWAEQQEENFQPDDIAKCRQEFESAVARVEDAVRPRPVARKLEPKQIPKPLPGPFTVYFDLDSSLVSKREGATVAQLIDAIKETKPTTVYIAGYADTTGADDHNDKLSMRRARSIAQMLSQAGVPDSAIKLDAFGARSPKVPTGPGVAEHRNRVVEISFTK